MPALASAPALAPADAPVIFASAPTFASALPLTYRPARVVWEVVLTSCTSFTASKLISLADRLTSPAASTLDPCTLSWSDTVRLVLPPELMLEPVWVMRSEEHTSELQSLMRISYAVLCLNKHTNNEHHDHRQKKST